MCKNIHNIPRKHYAPVVSKDNLQNWDAPPNFIVLTLKRSAIVNGCVAKIQIHAMSRLNL